MLGFDSSTIRKARKASFVASAASRQKGAYAVEFAFVFVIFFLVLYGIITYGLIFAAQQSMNFAAESGARAGLQWQAGNSTLALAARAEKALEVSKDHSSWVDQMAGGNTLKMVACSVQLKTPESEDGTQTFQVLAYPDDSNKSLCSLTNTAVDANKLEVVIYYPYQEAPMIPYLGPSSIMSVAVPTALQGRATVDLGIALDHSS